MVLHFYNMLRQSKSIGESEFLELMKLWGRRLLISESQERQRVFRTILVAACAMMGLFAPGRRKHGRGRCSLKTYVGDSSIWKKKLDRFNYSSSFHFWLWQIGIRPVWFES